MITINQQCVSCGELRVIHVPGFGSADVAEEEQMRLLNLALVSKGWMALGVDYFLDPSCLEDKLGLTVNEGAVPPMQFVRNQRG